MVALVGLQGGLDQGSQTVSGYHGWVYAYYQEKAGNFTQTGSDGADCTVRFLKIIPHYNY